MPRHPPRMAAHAPRAPRHRPAGPAPPAVRREPSGARARRVRRGGGAAPASVGQPVRTPRRSLPRRRLATNSAASSHSSRNVGMSASTSAAPCMRRLQHREAERLVASGRGEHRGAAHQRAAASAPAVRRAHRACRSRTVAPFGPLERARHDHRPARQAGGGIERARILAVVPPASRRQARSVRSALAAAFGRRGIGDHACLRESARTAGAMRRRGCCVGTITASARRSPRRSASLCHCQSGGSCIAAHGVPPGARCRNAKRRPPAMPSAIIAACDGRFRCRRSTSHCARRCRSSVSPTSSSAASSAAIQSSGSRAPAQRDIADAAHSSCCARIGLRTAADQHARDSLAPPGHAQGRRCSATAADRIDASSGPARAGHGVAQHPPPVAPAARDALPGCR